MLLSLLVVAILVLLGMGLIVGLAWWRQEDIVFQPPPAPYPLVSRARRLDYTATDDQTLFSYVVGDPATSPRTILVFHGNADTAAGWIPWALELAQRTHAAVIIAEYRGYAGLSGRPTYSTSRLDAKAAYAATLDAFELDPRRFVIFGHSLGTAIATELAVEHTPRVLILQSPFTSARAMARIIVARVTVLAWNAISRVHYDTESLVATIPCEVWVAHGSRDLIIPVRMGRHVHRVARQPGELLIVDGAGHNDVSDVGEDRYWRWITSALSR